jgi:hypothetical protein
MSNNILRFADLGEAATRRILAGWCGPLVPEPPSDEHDHRKTRLMYMDCTSPETVEGHVLTFTYSQWSRGTELVFEDGTPRGVGADVAVGRRVLSWETCWKWIQGAGMDCARPEVSTWLAGLCGRVLLTTDPDESARLVRVALNASMHPLNEGEATALAALVLNLARRIAAIR